MRYFSLLILLLLTSIPAFTDDTPDITQVARFGRGTAYTLAWRPDGEVLAVGSSTGVWFFDEDFNELGRLAEDMTVDSLEWSPDGERLIAFNDSYQTEKCQLIIWNVSLDLQTVSQDKVFDYCAESVDWSPNGKLIAIGVGEHYTKNTGVSIISADSYALIATFSNLREYIAFSSNSQYLAINSDNSETPLNIIDSATGDIIQQTDNTEVFGEVKWSFDGNYISLGCDPEGNDTFRNQRGTCVLDIRTRAWLNTGLLFNFYWHPLKNHFITTGRAGYGMTPPSSIIRYYDEISENFVMDIDDIYYQETIYSHVWHPSGQYLLGITISGQIVKIDITAKTIETQNILFQPPSHTVSWIPDSLSMLSFTGYWDNLSQVNIWEMNQTLPVKQNIIDNIDLIQWIENSQDFIIHSWKDSRYYTATIYDSYTLTESGHLFHFVEQTILPTIRWANDVSSVAYTETNTVIIENEVFANQTDNIKLSLQVDRLRQIEWSPDDTMIATVGEIGDESVYNFLVEIWDAKTGEPLSSFFIEWLMHYDHFIWNPDGKSIAVTSNRTTGGGCEMSIGVYDIQIGEFYEIAPTMPRLYWGKYCDDPIFYSPEPQASWSPDGGMIAVSFDDAVRIFNIREVTVPIKIPIEKINTLDWHESGKYLAGGASDGTIYVWDMSALMEN